MRFWLLFAWTAVAILPCASALARADAGAWGLRAAFEGMRSLRVFVDEPVPYCKNWSAPPSENVGCLSLAQNFCKNLFAAPSRGNLDLGRDPVTESIRMGKSANEIDEPSLAYYRAKLTARGRFPSDFRKELDAHGYFEALGKYIARKPPSRMTPAELRADRDLVDRLSRGWNRSFEEAVAARMEALHPGFNKLADLPPSYEIEQAAISERLKEEMSEATWGAHPRWKATQELAKDVRAAFLDTIRDDLNLDRATIARWTTRIREIEVVLPERYNTMLDYSDVKNCDTTLLNAFYDHYANKLAICAGEMTAGNPLTTLAHEFSHAVAPESELVQQRLSSRAGSMLRALEKSVCGQDGLPCKDWTAWKGDFQKALASMKPQEPPLAAAGRCLQDDAKLPVPDAEYLDDIAKAAAKDRTEVAASRNRFLKLAKKEIYFGNGEKAPNPAYLNPCGLLAPRRETNPFELASLHWFSQEFRCQSSGDEAGKVKASITLATNMQIALNRVYTPFLGRFSSDHDLTRDGYSSDIDEKFADILGMRVVAKVLAKQPSLQKRRDIFLSSQATICEPPSLSTNYPDEAEAEKAFSHEPHSLMLKRLKERLTGPIREALHCEKDFDLRECKL